MPPQIIRTDTGRIITVANFPSVGASSESAVDSITSKIFLAGSVGESDIDTYVFDRMPSSNNSAQNQLFLGAENELYSGIYIFRTFLKCPINKILHLYFGGKNYGYPNPNGLEDEVKEINPSSFDIETLTWNTQPTLGFTIYTFSPTTIGWYSLPTGTLGAICIKQTDETADNASAIWFYSTNNPDVTKRPYFTEP